MNILQLFRPYFDFCFRLILILSVFISPLIKASTINITGKLIDEPCTILPKDGVIEVDFSDITVQTLYNNLKVERNFAIELEDCSNTKIKTVSVSFNGAESASLKGLLALDKTSLASGIAIGIESNGKLIQLNQDKADFNYQSGSQSLLFNAFVQAEPSAIQNRSIQEGPFSATATFLITYY